jgi:hypothetical protein
LPLSVYHYRLVATNAGGTTEGADETFTTPAEAVSQGAASSPFGVGISIPPPGITYPSLSSTRPAPEVRSPSTTGAPVKPFTRAPNACRRDARKGRRSRCEVTARRRYGKTRRR